MTKPVPASDALHRLTKYLFQHKVATCAQIQRDVFPRLKLNTVAKKLYRYEQGKVICQVSSLARPRENIYALGKRTLCDVFGVESVTREQRLSSSVEHDLQLVDILSRIKTFDQVMQVYTENVLRSGHSDVDPNVVQAIDSLNPDAVLEVNFGDDPLLLAIEYEASIKVKRRYASIFQNYYFASRLAGVLYICETKSMMQKLMSIEKEVMPETLPKIYYTTRKELLTNEQPSFENLQKQILKFSVSSTPPISVK